MNKRKFLGQHKVIVKSMKAIQNILLSFGDLVRNIMIDFGAINEIEGQQIIQMVSDLCSETLRRLFLEKCHGRILTGLKRPFKDVNFLVLSSSEKKPYEIDENQKFNQLFPKLDHLDLNLPAESDWPFVTCENPNLTWLDLHNVKDSNVKMVANFLKINSNIQTSKLYWANRNTLKEISENLPKLKTLTIVRLANYFSYNCDDDIHFESVESLSMVVCGKDTPENIHFHQLQKLHLQIDSEFTDKWMHFLNQTSSNVNRIKIYTGKMKNEHLLNIPMALPSLKTVTIEAKSKFKADDVGQFIEKSIQLNTLNMLIEMDQNERNILEKNLEKLWTITFTPTFETTNKIRVHIDR